jgi:hypothetical protein
VLVAYIRDEDSDHGRAQKLVKEVVEGKYGEFFVTDYIFDEVVTAILNKSKSVIKAVEAGVFIEQAMELKQVGKINFFAAWQLFKTQRGTKLSFTDCATICTADIEGIEHIATFDGDFKKVNGVSVIDS